MAAGRIVTIPLLPSRGQPAASDRPGNALAMATTTQPSTSLAPRAPGPAEPSATPAAAAAGTPAAAAAGDLDSGHSQPPAAAAGLQPDQSPHRSAGAPHEPPRVRRQAAARRIREAAELCGTADIRDTLRRLAELTKAGAGNPQKAEFVEAAIAACLEAATAAARSDRWLACEAATWALAWMARARRAGGSAGGLLEHLVGQARDAEPILAGGDTRPARFVLQLARLFQDIEACSRLEAGATAAVAAEMERLVSDEGIINLPGSGPMLERAARWTAFRQLALETGGACPWAAPVERRWRAAATTALRLLGDGGRQPAGAGLMPARFTAGLRAAVADEGGWRERTVAAVRGRQTAAETPPKCLPRDLHDPAAGMAIIRSGWGRGAVRILVDFRSAVPHLEIAAGDRMLVSGEWAWQVTAEGRPLETAGPWTVACWESDRKASFLDLTAPLSDGRQLERQVVMLPQDGIVLLADVVTTPGEWTAARGNGSPPSAAEPALAVTSSLPLGPGLATEAADETREVLVFDTRMRFQALPLGLPEWRTGRGGQLRAVDGRLTLEQQTEGSRLYAPLWLDCNAARIGRPLTWRQLTVADTRINLPAHQAIGYRIQAGLDQWLVYRTLDVARNRSLLGCNVSCEFLLGRIKPRGMVKRVLEIQ